MKHRLSFLILLFFIFIQNNLPAQSTTIDGYTPPESRFKGVAINPNGLEIATINYNNYSIIIFESFSGKEIKCIPFSDYLRNFYYVNDTLIVAVSSSKISLIHTTSGQIVKELTALPFIFSSDFAYTSGSLICATQEGLYLIDCNNHSLTIVKKDNKITSEIASISSDGKHLVYREKNKIISLSLPTFRKECSLSGENVDAFGPGTEELMLLYKYPFSYQKFNYDGKPSSETQSFTSIYKPNVPRIKANGNGFIVEAYKSVVFINESGYQTILKTDEIFYGFELLPNQGKGVIWNPYGIKTIDIEGLTFAEISSHAIQPIENLYFVKSGQWVHIADSLIAIRSNSSPRSTEIPLPAGFARAWQQNEWLVISQRNGELNLFNSNNWENKYNIQIGFTPNALFIDSENSLVILSNFIQNNIREWNVSTGSVKPVFADSAPITALVKIGNTLYLGNKNGDFHSLDNYTIKSSEKSYLSGGISVLKDINNQLVIGSFGRFIFRNLDLSEAHSTLYVGHNGFITDVLNYSQTSHFFTCATDHTVKLWNYDKKRLLHHISLDSIGPSKTYSLGEDTLLMVGNGYAKAVVVERFHTLVDPPYAGSVVVQEPNNSRPLKMAINPEGNLLAAVDENTAKIRDLKSGFLISECTTDNNTVNGIAFAQEGNMLVVAAGSNIQCFDALTGKTIRTIDLSKSGHPGYLGNAPAFLGRSIHDVECVNNGIIAMNHFGWHNPILIHKNSGLKLGEIFINPSDDIDNQLMDLKYSLDGKTLITMGSDYVKAFSNGNKMEQMWSIPREGIGKTNRQYMDFLNISPDGKYLLFVDFDPYFRIKTVDIKSGIILQNNPGGIGAFAKNGNYIYVKSKKYLAWRNVLDSTYRLLDIEFDAEINNIVYNNQSDIFAISDIFGNIKILEGRSGNQIFEISRWKQYTYNSVLHHSGNYLMFNNRYGLFTVNMNNLKRQALHANNYPLSGVFSPQSDLIYYRKNDTFYSQNLTSGNTQLLFVGKFNSDDFISMAVSSDGQILYYRTANDSIHLFHLNKREFIFHFHAFSVGKADGIVLRDVVTQNQSYYLQGIGIKTYGNKSGMQHVLMSIDGKFSMLPLSKEIVYIRSSDDGFDELRFRRDTKVFGLSPSKKYTSFMHDYRLFIVDNNNGDTIFSRDNPILNQINTAIFNQNEQWFIIGFDDGHIEIFDLINNRSAHNNEGEYSGLNLLKSITINSMGIEHIQLTENRLLVKGQNPFISILNPNDDFKKQLDMDFIQKEDQIYINPEGYYYSTKPALNFIGYKRDISIYPFEQVDLIYNRPDKVLTSVGCADSALIKSFQAAHLKRLAKNPSKLQNTSDFSNPPLASITNIANIPLDNPSEFLDLNIHAESVSFPLQTMNVWVNGVPCYGEKGKTISLSHRTNIDTSIRVALSNGRNEIKVSVTDKAGNESFKTPILVNHTSSKTISAKVYFLGFGIEKYKDSSYNLKYSVKDIQDIEKSLRFRYGDTLISYVFTNESVTSEGVGKAKNILLQTSIHDKVIVAFSGHGLLSPSYDYYLSSYATDFNKPEKNGIPYELFENLLDSIPARQKLMMIDACHSGEVDKDEALQIQAMADSLGLSKGSKIRNTAPPASHLGLSNSFELMQELFVNVGKGTGATVISASAGSQFALERGDLKNGVFTYSILEAMANHSSMTVGELKSVVGKRVEELTHGMQKPTSRNETIYNDWRVW